MKVIILGAGQGKRLLPLTEDVPKALLDIGGRRLVERQVDAFVASGIKEFVVITGYAHDAMQEALRGLASELNVEIRTVYNPFFAVADNLASCWMARQEMTGDFIQVNGDNLFKPDLVEHFLSAPHREVTVAVSHKGSYDADDMKVMMDGERVTEIGKMLPLEAVDAEAMGFYLFKGEGGPKFVEVIERM
ncbi:MAG: sugar phosphate nucleotidyltransferase, partial [Hyphomicrobiales bacterium]